MLVGHRHERQQQRFSKRLGVAAPYYIHSRRALRPAVGGGATETDDDAAIHEPKHFGLCHSRCVIVLSAESSAVTSLPRKYVHNGLLTNFVFPLLIYNLYNVQYLFMFYCIYSTVMLRLCNNNSNYVYIC
jgi:hypothetical protein